ncbi:MAG: 3-isopropylmalate dehydratase small subunit [Acidimicrobiia bacterium]|nr:MAG: 3-isopropylmalate dehydratase small subunit [Acidimicrobiia bacterium]
MKPVSIVEGQMAPLPDANIDTDQIIPKQFLKGVKRTGLGPNLFYNWAHDVEGEREPAFVLNRPEYAEASVLVAGPNFGCGSSREHAVWSLHDAGFDAILAPSFGPILENNCYQNGLLPVVLSEEDAAKFAELATDPANSVTIDLPAQQVSSGDFTATFDIDPHVKQRLLNGWDQVDITLQSVADIEAYESSRPRFMPALG